MFCSCKKLYISGFTLILRIHFGTLHMLPFKSFPVIIIGFSFFKDILLLLRSPLSCSFSFLNKLLFFIPRSKNSLIGFCCSSRHRINLLCQANHTGHLRTQRSHHRFHHLQFFLPPDYKLLFFHYPF